LFMCREGPNDIICLCVSSTYCCRNGNTSWN